MLKRNLLRGLFLFLLCWLGLVVIGYSQQQPKVTYAFLDAPNVFSATQSFQQGFALRAYKTGAITIVSPVGSISSYKLVLPSSGGLTGYYICVGAQTGTLTALAHCPASGSGGPLVSASPSPLNFASVTAHTTSTLSVLITNTGNALLTFSGTAFTFTGTNSGDFRVSLNTASTCVNAGTLVGGATCTLSLDFTPGATGVRTGTLNISDDAPGSPQLVTLNGTGV